METGSCRYGLTIAPVSGKAIPLERGEVLRISQTTGEQCVDFNCFNLHNYKERMSVGHMRAQGFRVREGHLVVSAPPHDRPMMVIAHMSEKCVTDLLAARCDATMGEREYGLISRTNCQDTFSEAIREYGLSPDDVHDSFNMWMHTCWRESFRILPNVAPANDYVDLLALMDVLAVPIICGSGDLGQVSNFYFSAIQVKVFLPSGETLARVDDVLSRFNAAPSDAELPEPKIRISRELRRDPNYRSKLQPISYRDIAAHFSTDEIDQLAAHPFFRLAGDSSEHIRTAFMLWYRENRMRQRL